MGLKADHKYVGKVGPGSSLIETQSGTMGYQLMLGCEHGETTFTIWLTEKNRARAEKYFDILGVDLESLKASSFLEFQLGQILEGKDGDHDARLRSLVCSQSSSE